MASTTVVAAPAQNSVVVLLGRVFLAAIFIMAGFGKLSDIAGTAGYFASMNLPVPNITAVVVAVVELLGGIAVLVGFKTRIAAWLLAIFCVASAFVAHMNWADMGQLINFQKNISMAGGFLVLAAFGPGALSIDRG